MNFNFEVVLGGYLYETMVVVVGQIWWGCFPYWQLYTTIAHGTNVTSMV